jgi:putative membrane protein
MVKLLSLAAVLAAALVVCAPAGADEKNRPADDKDFVVKAMTCGTAEVKISELAEKHASNEKVKEFARMMVTEHTKASEQLAEHSKNQKVAVAAGLDRDKQTLLDMLSKLNGAEFDRAYMQQMVDDHVKAVQLFEAQAKNGTDPDLKKFAEMTLPKLREHLVQARTVNVLLKDAKEKGKSGDQ